MIPNLPINAARLSLFEQNRVLAPIIAEIRARADRMEAIQPVMRTYFAGYIHAFTEVIQQGIDGGELRGSPHAGDAALAYVALIEGADLPLDISMRGMVPTRVRQLRDPAIFIENDRTYLLYTVAGEQGIAIAEILFT